MKRAKAKKGLEGVKQKLGETSREAAEPLGAGWADGLDSYAVHLELERGRSPHTVAGYLKDLGQCARWAAAQGYGGWAALDAAGVNAWLGSLTASGYAARSVARKLSAVKGIIRYLRSEGQLGGDMETLLRGPRLGQRLPGSLSCEQVEALLAAPGRHSPQGLRDRAILELLYSSGLRVSELCALTLQTVDLEAEFVRVDAGKRGKDRIVPVGGPAVAAVKDYLAAGRPAWVKPHTGSILFISRRGGGLSRKTVWHWIQHYARQIGIAGGVKPHLLRHSFATHLLANGADLRAIQEMLGHADIGTTEIYTRVDAERMLAGHAAYHPRNTLLNNKPQESNGRRI